MTTTTSPSQEALSSAEIERLTADGMLLRVLQPSLQIKIERALQKANPDLSAYVVRWQDQVYLSFAAIKDPQQRHRARVQLQRYQLEEPTPLSAVPGALRRCLQPESTQSGRMIYAVAIGSSVGIIAGILAMAVSILATTILELTTGITIGDFAGMQLTAVSFVIFGVLSWMLGTYVAWRRLRS